MNKKNICIIVIGIIIILLLIYYSNRIINNNSSRVNKIKIVENNVGEKEDFINYGSINDDEIAKIKPFKFSVINKESNNSKYNLLIEDIVDNEKEELILSRKYLHYELSLNNNVIKKGILSDIKNNIIDTRTIKKNKTNNYSLKIWVSLNDSEIDLEHKYYSYNIVAIPIE